MKKWFGLVTGVAILVAASCSKSGDDNNGGGNNNVDCNTISTSFSTNVAPLIASSCAKSGCHATAGNGPGALTTYAQISAAKVQIRQAVASGNMPKDATLNATQKATITCWIDAGAPNN